jgi:hypothetical protein
MQKRSKKEGFPLTETPTYAEIMALNLLKIADALNELQSIPLLKELILLYVQERTHLGRKEIEAVFDAIAELNQKVEKK